MKYSGPLLSKFTIGLGLGPGFFSALRRDGLRLNALAVLIVFLGTAIAVLSGWLFGLIPKAVLGIELAVPRTRSVTGAAQQTIAALPGVSESRQALPALAYAVTYPGAIVGIIASLLSLKAAFHIDPVKEGEALTAEQQHVGAARHADAHRRNRILPWCGGRGDSFPRGNRGHRLVSLGGVIPRGKRRASTRLQPGDLIVIVGAPAMLDQFQRVVGRPSNEDLSGSRRGTSTEQKSW